MSYDTTVHDALEPPSSRIRDDVEQKQAPRLLRRALRAWRLLAATSITISTVFLVTWVVAALTFPSLADQSKTTDVDSTSSQQQRLTLEREP